MGKGAFIRRQATTLGTKFFLTERAIDRRVVERFNIGDFTILGCHLDNAI